MVQRCDSPDAFQPSGVATIEGLTAGALELAAAWDAVAYRLGEGTLPSSPCAREAANLPSHIEDPQQLTRAIVQDAATYVSAASQHLRVLGSLLGPEIVLTGWSLTRALVEHCGRAAWLLGPAERPTDRVARYYMEWIVSLHMARLAAERADDQKQVKELKRKRSRLLNLAKQVFPDAELFKSNELNEWSVGGEPYAGLAKAVNGSLGFLGGKGLYDVLSTFTHPSLYRLHTQVQVTKLEDRFHNAFTADPDVIRWQLVVASTRVYEAGRLIVGYLELDGTELEQWADRHPTLLAWSRSVDEASGC